MGGSEAWPLIYKEAATRPVLGHGIGASYAFVPTVWYGMNHVHNEFLRIFFELGLVGLTIFVVALVSQLWQGLQRSSSVHWFDSGHANRRFSRLVLLHPGRCDRKPIAVQYLVHESVIPSHGSWLGSHGKRINV